MQRSNKLTLAILLCISSIAAAAEYSPPSLNDVIELNESGVAAVSARVRAIEQAGLATGANAGFANRIKEIAANYCLMPDTVPCSESSIKKMRSLDGIFMFAPLVDQRGFLPPVITEVTDSADVESGRMVISGKTYRIIRAARFVQGVPTWRDYLMVGLEPPEIESLPKALLPNTDQEKAVWRDAVENGWKAGMRRADDVLTANIDRLRSDYLGMLRYKKLIALRMVDSPIIARGVERARVTDNEVTMNIETSEIMAPARMEKNPDSWKTDLVVEHE